MAELRVEVLDQGTTLRLVDPAGTPLGRRSLEAGEIDALVEEVASAYDRRLPDLDRLGRRLFDWLDGSGQRWLSTRLDGLRGEGLTLRLDVVYRLRHLPWELATGGGGLLAADVSRPFCPVREVARTGRGWETANRPLRALFMAASPENVNPVLDYETEEVRILAAAGGAGVELVVEEQGSLAGLRRRLRDHEPGWYDVVHLTGHAGVSADDVPHLLLETDTGLLDRVNAERLIEAVEGRWPRVVFVSGCRTGAAPDGGLLPSFAERLVAAGAPCVIGWGHPVGDAAANDLAAAFYEQLGVGERLDVAIARARLALLQAHSDDWHLLRAYADGSGLTPLVTPSATPGRPRLRIRRADLEFLDANSQRPVCAHDRFVGRRRLLQRCLRALTVSDQADPAYAEGVALHGLGGLGKSSAAARLCERLGGYRRLVWVGELDGIELARVVGEQLGPQAAAILNQPGVDARQGLRQLLDGLNEPVVFVLDDFEQNVEGQAVGDPRFDAQGRALLRPEALRVLDALLWAIRQSASPARVIMTCRYRIASPPGPARLVEEALEALAGAELAKKTAHLESFSATGATAAHRASALRLADGNPRLLEALDKALAIQGVDTDSVLASLDAVTAEFREAVLAQALVAAQSPETTRVLACLAVCRLPVDAAAVGVIAAAEVATALAQANAAGLVEAGVDPSTGAPRYRVPGLATNLLEGVVGPDEQTQATARAAQHLWSTWWEADQGIDEPRALELVRLSLAAGHLDHAARITDVVTNQWIFQARFVEAAILTEQVLAHIDNYGVRHNLARAQQTLGHTAAALANYKAALAACPPGDAGAKAAILANMAGIRAAQGEPEAAMDLYRQALEIAERIGDAKGKAATLDAMANIVAAQGEPEAAMDLYRQALEIAERIGDAQGKAATLHEMAGIRAAQGEPEAAMDLYRQSLEIEEGIGDAQGKAVTLHAMATIRAAQGEPEAAMDLFRQSLEINERIGGAGGKAAILHAMAGIRAAQGEPEAAMDLFRQSLEINERIGGAQGKAATLAGIGFVQAGAGDIEGAMSSLQQSAVILAGTGRWPDLAVVIANLGALAQQDGASYRAQAAWLATAVHVQANLVLKVADELVQELGPEHETSLLLSLHAAAVAKQAEHHHAHEQLLRGASGMVDACLQARNVSPEQANTWLTERGLLDLGVIIERLRPDLEALVPEDRWLFDRAQIVNGAPPVPDP